MRDARGKATGILIDNAIDAMEGEGSLRLATSLDGDDVVVEITERTAIGNFSQTAGVLADLQQAGIQVESFVPSHSLPSSRSCRMSAAMNVFVSDATANDVDVDRFAVDLDLSRVHALGAGQGLHGH